MKLTTLVALILLLFALSCKKDKQPDPIQPPTLSSDKDITEFTFNSADNAAYLSYGFKGTITNDTIKFDLPSGTQVSHLVPAISMTGVAVTPNSGIAQDFSSPVTYTVTAADKTTKQYVVIVTVQIADAFDVIYTAGTNANMREGHVYAINADDGTLLWSAKTSASVTATPITNETVLVADSNALRALDKQTGTEIWRFETKGIIRSIPSVYNGTVYFQNDDMMLYAVDIATGILR